MQSTVDEIDKLYGKCSKGKSLALALVVDVTSENQVKLSIQRGIEEFRFLLTVLELHHQCERKIE